MVDISSLKPGDRIRIVDQWEKGCNENTQGLMDKYLGQVVTVHEIRNRIFSGEPYVTIEEDNMYLYNGGDKNRRWIFNAKTVAEIVDGGDDFDVGDIGDMKTLLSGVGF